MNSGYIEVLEHRVKTYQEVIAELQEEGDERDEYYRGYVKALERVIQELKEIL